MCRERPCRFFRIEPGDGFFIGNFEIKWYAVVIAFGLLLAVLYAMRRCKEFGLTADDIYNIVFVGLPSAIVGARAYYVIFEWKQYFGPGIPWYKCLMIRDGGLAIYGAVIAALLAATIYCMTSQKRRAKLLPYMDIGSIGLLIGQGIGRWGNFFNSGGSYGGKSTNGGNGQQIEVLASAEWAGGGCVCHCQKAGQKRPHRHGYGDELRGSYAAQAPAAPGI